MRAPPPESCYREVQVPFEICKNFRKKVVDQDGLIEDYWDAHSDHMALYRHNALIATYRIVRPAERRLPISEQEPSLAVDVCDRQIGRLVTSQNRLTLDSMRFFYPRYLQRIRELSGRIYVATAEWGPISVRRYIAMGFHDTGIRYKDGRYPYELSILVKQSAN
jgi:hypothetical protein